MHILAWSIVKAVLLNGLSLLSFLISLSQDPLHQQRVATIEYVLESLKEDSVDTRTILNEVFDETTGPYPFDKGYDDWLNLYLSQKVDTFSKEEAQELSIQDKRILSHEVYFQQLKKRLKAADYASMQIIPYTSVEDPKSLSSGNTVDESEVNNTYVVIYSYQEGKKAEYILFNENDKIRSIAHITWAPGESISGVTFL